MRKRIWRIVSLILVLVCTVGLIPAVHGADTVMIDHEYSKYIGRTDFQMFTQYAGYPTNMVFSTGDYWTETMAYFTTTDGRIAFCLEPSVSGTTGGFININWTGVDQFKRKGIAYALAYGAPNNGDTSEAGLMATAAVVWDMACGYRDRAGNFMVDGDHGTAITSSPFGAALQAQYPAAYTEYNNILARLAKHGTVPSFSVKSRAALASTDPIVLKYDAASGTYKASVTDTNGVMESFNFISTIDGLSFAKSGNTLNIAATKEAAAQLSTATTIRNRGNEVEVSEDLCTVWYPDGGGQKVCTLDAPTDPVPCYFNLLAEDVEAEVSVVKTSTDGKVDGITFSVKNNTTGTTGTYTTAGGGRFSFKATVGDSVTITEHVPEGYVNTAASQTITVAAGGNTVTFSNVLRQGQITVNKTAETFSSVTHADGVYQPVYAEAPLAGAVFEIRAAEEIKAPDGSTVLATGELADTITTDATGTATSKLLYLGRYTVTEITAPTGTALYPMSKDVILEYTGSEGAVVPGSAAFVNQRQRAVLSLVKILEADPEFGITQGAEITSVKFGLYAAEAMTAADGSTIPADGLLEAAACDAEGKITFQTDLPYGARVYIQEIATAEGYVLNDTKYPVDFPELNQDVVKVDVAVNDGAAIENDLIRGTILGKKIDEDGFTICGATFGLFRQYETEFTEETAILTSVSNEIGVFGFEDVPYGSYIVREIKPAPGFVLNEDLYGVEVTENEVVLEGTIENKFLTGSVQVTKVDAEDTDTKLSGAVFEVYVDVDRDEAFDESIDLLVGEMTEGEAGVYRMDNLRYNGYFVHEKAVPEGYLQDNGYYYFAIREDGEVVTVENKAGVGFVNTLIRGSVAGKKVDNTGKGLAGAVIGLFPADAKVFTTDAALMTAVSAEDGSFSFDEVPYGAYIVREIKAPEGYILTDKSYNITIHADGELIRVEIPNTPEPVVPTTGDTGSILLWFLLLTLSAAGTAVMLRVMQRRRGW